jgi:hypothetical protein
VLRWVAAGSARRLAPAGPGPGWAQARTDQPESGRSSESSGRGRLERGGRAGPGPARPGQARMHSGVRLQAREGADAGPPHCGGGRAQPALFPPHGVAALLCVSVCGNRRCVDLAPSRGLGVDALALLRRRCAAHGSLMAQRGSSHAGLRPPLL